MRRARGYTLVETMLVSVVLTIIGGAILVLGTTGRQVWVRTDTQLASQTQAAKVVSLAAHDLRSAVIGSVSTATCVTDWLRFTNQADQAVEYRRQADTGILERLQQGVVVTTVPGVTQFQCALDATLPNLLELTVTARERMTALRGEASSTVRTRVLLRNPDIET